MDLSGRIWKSLLINQRKTCRVNRLGSFRFSPVTSGIHEGQTAQECRYAIYTGESMSPTLRDPEVVEIKPYTQRTIRKGDVILFTHPDKPAPIIHRVINISHSQIRTRGDNNPTMDGWILSMGQIIGQVTAGWSGSKRRIIFGGFRGQLMGFYRNKLNLFIFSTIRYLKPFYHWLYQKKVVYRVVQGRVHPKILQFHGQDTNHYLLFLDEDLIGRYDETKHQWVIRRPFRLLLDEESLKIPDDTTSHK